MIKKISVIIFLLLLTSCSFDTSSGIWENKKKEKKKITELNMDDLDKDLSMAEYKLIIIEYGKNSEYLDINNFEKDLKVSLSGAIICTKFFGNEKTRFVLIGSVILVSVQVPSIIGLSLLYGINGAAIGVLLGLACQAIYLIFIDKISQK